MLNPIFWIVFIVTLIISLYSFSDWKRGIVWFFIYIQFAGIIKRIMVSWGIDDVFYNLFVGFQYIIIISIIMGIMMAKPVQKHPNKKTFRWLLFFTLILCFSVFNSPFGFTASISMATVQYFPIYTILIGRSLKNEQLDELIEVFVRTAPIHALYQVYQFFMGPFNFEVSFINEKYSVINVSKGDFIRGIPLYDSVDPLYIHFAIVFIYLLKSRKTFLSFFNMASIIIALIMIGNRSGLILLVLAVMIFLLIDSKIHYKKMLLTSIIFLSVSLLSVFSVLLSDVIQSAAFIDLGRSDFASRWGELQTYMDRIVGRKNAFENVSVLGLGLGTSGLGASTLVSKGFDIDSIDRDIYAHDIVGEIILDFGVVGFLIFGILIFRLMQYPMNHRKTNLLLAIIFTSFITSSLLGGSFTYGRAGYFIFLFSGFILANQDDSIDKKRCLNDD